ncbi:MAG: methyltransferase domain-containing protein [Gemmatimonadaceae bacterium]|nr:methyltransferase domain-containing protein [Gemmatimonadaceae bacterium]
MTDVNPPAVRILDLGCGNKKRPGAVGVDFNDRTQADVVHNLNEFPYPFEKGTFDEVYLDNTLEHLDQPLHVMEEVYRITRPGALVKVIVPYFRSPWAFHDPTHQHFFTVHSFAYYDPDHIVCQRYDYTLARFKVEKIRFNETYGNRWTKRIMLSIAHRWPARYEYYVSHLYALDELAFYLRRI